MLLISSHLKKRTRQSLKGLLSMSKMRSYLKPPLPKSPIRLRSRQVLNTNASSLQTPTGYQKPRRISDANLEPKLPCDYASISSQMHALAKMVKDEFAEEEDSRKTSSNLEDLAANSIPVFERGRFYEEYAAKRNERLRKKKGEEESLMKGTFYNLGVNHEPMTNKRRGGTVKKTTTVSMVDSTPRYSLRSMMKPKKKPPPIPLHVSAIKSVTTRRGRRS